MQHVASPPAVQLKNAALEVERARAKARAWRAETLRCIVMILDGILGR